MTPCLSTDGRPPLPARSARRFGSMERVTTAERSVTDALLTPAATRTSAPAMIATDLDGTLLGVDGEVSPRNAAALARASAAGAHVVVATGRPVTSLTPVVDAGFDGLAVCMNGAVVYDISARRIQSATVIEPAVLVDVVTELERLPYEFGLAVDRIAGDAEEFWAEPSYAHPWADRSYQRAERAALLASPAAKLLVAYREQSDEIFDAASRAGADRVTMTYSAGDGLFEVAAAGVTKGAVLARLAAGWGIDAADVVAFGDMRNDLEMLTWAGRSVAMANAIAEVAAAASEVGPRHDEDGVAQVLERWF